MENVGINSVQDERIKTLKEQYHDMSNDIKDIKTSVDNIPSIIRAEIDALKEYNDKKYVSNEKFEPFKLIIYGLVSTVLLAFLGALLSGIFA